MHWHYAVILAALLGMGLAPALAMDRAMLARWLDDTRRLESGGNYGPWAIGAGRAVPTRFSAVPGGLTAGVDRGMSMHTASLAEMWLE